MNLRTECPRCVTLYEVSSEQLREAQGWVRCGVCQEVFGAQAHALREAVSSAEDAPLPLRQVVQSHSLEAGDANAPSQSNVARPSGGLKRRKSMGGWWVVSGLILLLLAQLAWQQRNRIAAQFPLGATWLQAVCATEACNFRNIADITIADSNFSAPDPSHFRLSAFVANRSTVAMEVPHLVLTLTDSADRVIARKSYEPLQWGASTNTMPAQTTWPVVLWIRFDPSADSPPVVGYRLKAFYP